MPTSIRIEISGDLAYAAYFVMAFWQNPATAPQLETSYGPLAILIERSSQALDELRQTLRMVGARTIELAGSAAALLAEVERQTSDGPVEVRSPGGVSRASAG